MINKDNLSPEEVQDLLDNLNQIKSNAHEQPQLDGNNNLDFQQ